MKHVGAKKTVLAFLAAASAAAALAAGGPAKPAAKARTPAELKPAARMDSTTRDPARDPGIFGEYWWANRFLSRRALVDALKGKTVDLVLLGDSIMHFWEWKHPQSYAKLAAGRSVLNLGYGGDRTQHVLWRIAHGELDGYRAKNVMVMIGTNNNSSEGTRPEDVAAAVEEIVGRVRAKQPGARVILLPIFPRGENAQSARHAAARRRNDATNALLAKFAAANPDIVWIDFNDRLVDSTGWVPRSIMADEIHPTDAGYDIWLDALLPVLGK